MEKTLRDEIAMHALTGIISNADLLSMIDDNNCGDAHEMIAEMAYKIADEMLCEKKKHS